MSLQEYATLASRHEAFINDKTKWISDKYFTQQRLAGTNPMSLQRVTVHERGKAAAKCLVRGGGVGGVGGNQQSFIRGSTVPRFNPLTFYIRLWVNPKARTFSRIFQGRKIHLLAHLQTEMTDFATLSYTWKSEIPSPSYTWSWRRYPFRVEFLRIGHYREYPLPKCLVHKSISVEAMLTIKSYQVQPMLCLKLFNMNGVVVCFGSSLIVHNPLFFVHQLWQNKLMRCFYWSVSSKWRNAIERCARSGPKKLTKIYNKGA